MGKLFAIVVGSVLVAIGVFLLAGAPFVYSASAQTPKPQVPPKSGTHVPLTQVAETPDGSTGLCGEDFILFSFSQSEREVSSRIVWFSNDADSFRTSRALYYHWYDEQYNLIAASTTPLVARTEAPATFLEAPHPKAKYPAGFYRTYVYRGGGTVRVKYDRELVVVTIFLRSNARTCVIHKIIPWS